MFNLRTELLPLSIFYGNVKISFRIDEIYYTTFLESEPLPQDLPPTVHLKFKFRNFSQDININWRIHEEFTREFCKARLTISALQKDNPIQWIKDWILWHCRAYGVRRVVLYDNGSANRASLILQLARLEPEVKIICVDWPFPFGVGKNKFTQLGSVNHCRLNFPVASGYCINLDIDEYLYKSGGSLLEFLDHTLKYPKPGSVTIKEYLIPNITKMTHEEKVSRCFDFHYRFRQIGNHRPDGTYGEHDMTKIIYSYENIGYSSLHRTISEKNKSFSRRYKWHSKTSFYAKKIVRELAKPIYRFRGPKPTIDSYHVHESELLFFHFLGLNTGWRGIGQHPMAEPTDFNGEIHVREPRIVQLAKETQIL